jgi:hypothetical protein
VLDHVIGDVFRRFEVINVARGFERVERGEPDEGVVVEIADGVAMLRVRIRVGDYVLESLLRVPGFADDSVE